MSIRSPKYLLASLIVVLSMILFLTNANATTYFVRSGASGNGTSWANAWGNLNSISWSSLNAGDTVCVAGGSYSGNLNTSKSGTSGNPITVRRATPSDSTCGSNSSGWNSAYDAQVVMTGTITLSTSYVTIDGAVADGIKIVMQNPNGTNYVGIGVGAPTNFVTLRYIEVAGPCPAGQTCNQNGDHRSISLNNWNGSSYDLQNNMTMQYMNLHGACNLLWSAHSTNMIIEHSRFADSSDETPGNPNCHPNVIAEQDSTNITFRYNEITHWEVEGIMACPSGACQSSWQIYGNLWHDPFAGYHRILEAQSNANGPYLFYNNTVVNVTYECAGTANGGSYLAGSQSRNNLYYNSVGPCGLPSDDYDYANKALGEANGQTGTTDPFVNSAAKTIAGYHLKAHTNPGTNLGAPYNVDFDGNPRATWDRGAFEFGGSSASLPNPPAGLAAIVR